MKELSLNILDITENSVKAMATVVDIKLTESEEQLLISISDNGVGMSEEVLNSVSDPFYTTRTTRKVGMGIPLFRLAAEQTGGELKISSKHIYNDQDEHGTAVVATFNKNHIDCTPLGDIISTIVTLIQGHPNVDFVFTHTKADRQVELDTREVRAVLDGVPLDTYEVILWIKDNLTEQYYEFNKN